MSFIFGGDGGSRSRLRAWSVAGPAFHRKPVQYRDGSTPDESKTKDTRRVCLLFLVEMGGVEPPSERISSGTSPGAESCLRFPSPGANSHAQGSGSFIVHGALKALRTHVHHLSTPRPGPWSSRAGRSPLMQREELRCRCSLIYKFARF